MPVIAALRYRDPDAAIRFLTGAFGAREVAVHRDDAGGVAHAELAIEDGLIMLGGVREGAWLGGAEPDARAGTISLYVPVEDPDAHHARAAAVGADVVRPLTDEDYGSREYSVRDPDGHLWSFGTYRGAA